MLPPAPPLPDRIGRYRIDRKIGEGGMGVVYAAYDERLDRTVALKTIRGESDDTSRKRLWREARVAAGISHPNICQLFEIDETGDGLFIAMELLAGEPLSARLSRGALSTADAASVSLQTLDALEALHTRGLIHRDLKPSNLFLTPHGVKLLDFGLARPMSTGATGDDTGTVLTMAGSLVGTPNYMAPEQVRGEPLDGRADLFAMAALLFEMLAGRTAFGGATMIDILHAVLHEQPPALSGGGAVAALDRIVHRALQKNAADRYESAAVMAAAIRDVIALRESVEVAAPPVRPMTRLIALPFRVPRPDADTDFLAFSLPDAITTSLSGTRNLLMRSSAAAARFDPQAPDLRRLAADADVDMALMGTILRAGPQLRVTAQLVEAPAGTVVWSHASQHPVHDVFAVQDALSSGIVRSLAQSLGAPDSAAAPRDVPHSAAAYELYLRGNELARDWDRLAEARDVYGQCTALDPDFAPAWAGLGRCHRVLGKYFDVADGAALAKQAFDWAQALNPELPLLHKYYAQLECDAGRAVDAMRRLLRRARSTTDPEDFAGLVHALRYVGLLDASVAAHDEARRLDPNIQTSVLNTYSALGDFERILKDPDLHDSDIRSMALYRAGRREEALAVFEPSSADATPMLRDWSALILACLRDAPNARAQAEQVFTSSMWQDPEGYVTNGVILARLGSDEMALRALRTAVDGGFHVPYMLLNDPWLAPLRNHARFGEIVRLAQARHAEAVAVFRAEGGERLLGLRAAA